MQASDWEVLAGLQLVWFGERTKSEAVAGLEGIGECGYGPTMTIDNSEHDTHGTTPSKTEAHSLALHS